MTRAGPCELVVTPPAARAIRTGLTEAVAAAVVKFLTGGLINDPHRVPLRWDLAGIHSARRGTYRIPDRINDTRHEVVGLRIDHRRDAYGPN